MSDAARANDRIVYCREIDPDTVLHLASVGDSYLMRRFDGTDPFAIEEHPDYDEMRVCYKFVFDRPVTAEEATHPLTDEAWWAVHITEINAEVLVGPTE